MKIGFLITARLKSTRLPMKLLKEILGKTVIEHVIDRIKEINEIETIVLCTSTNHQDLQLIDIARKNNIYYFNGNEEDVLQRLLDASKLFNLDYMIGITGENPLFDIESTKETIQKIKTNKYDFICTKGLPIGCATYGIRTSALETVCSIKEIVDTEIWGYLINRPEIFEINTIEVENKLNWPLLRITMDYPEDYMFIKTIFENTTSEERKDLGLVLNFLRQNPKIISINAEKIQLDLDEETKKEINEYFIKNKNEILNTKLKIYKQYDNR